MHEHMRRMSYDEQREREMQSISSLLMRISRVRRYSENVPCLHEHMRRMSYDEQREREMQSISSLLMRISRVRKRQFIRFGTW